MAGKADIKAGSAFVELFIKDARFKQTLKSAGGAVQVFGAGIAAIGGAMTAAGAAIVVPMVAAVRRFGAVADELDNMSQRTGVATDELAFLKFAAEATGTSLEVVEAAIRNLEKKGVDPSNLARIAEELKAIPDPAKKAAKAMELFGKSGTSLIPMLSQLEELRKKFLAEGQYISPKDIAASAKLANAMANLGKIAERMVFSVAIALQPMLQPVVEFLTAAAVAVNKFSQANPGWTKFLAIVGAVLLVLGPIVVIAGLLVIKIGALVTAITAIATVAPAVIAFFTANAVAIGFVLLALAAVIATLAQWGYWLIFTEHGQRAMRGISKALAGVMAQLNKFTQAIQKTFSGVADAIAAGEIELAWEIVLTGMTAQWNKFIAEIYESLAVLIERIQGTVLVRILGRDGSAAMLREAAKGRKLDTERGMIQLERLRTRAAGLRAAAGQKQGDPSQPGYGMPVRSAAVIGTNARAALMSGQIMGTGKNPVVDTIMKLIKIEEKAAKTWDEIARNTRPRGVR